jgi:hypothetical protein
VTRLWDEQVQNHCLISGRSKGLSLLHRVQTGSGVLPPGLEADRSLPSSAELMNTWGYTVLSCIFSWTGA